MLMLIVEVGGSSVQAIRVDSEAPGEVVPLERYREQPWLLAAPGLVEGNRVRGAHHLGWIDVQASAELGMTSPPLLSMNDADAAAVGEWVLRDRLSGPMPYISLGTGVGATVVQDGTIVPIEFSHLTAFGPKRCGGCGRIGCLDAQIGGHALSNPLTADDYERIVTTLAAALQTVSQRFDRVIVGGGIARRYPSLLTDLSGRTGDNVEPTSAPPEYKSAAPFGLLARFRNSLNSKREQ